MTWYLVTRRLGQGAPVRPHPYLIGGAELRDVSRDTPSESSAIETSRRAYGEGADDIVAIRAAIIVDAVDLSEAFSLADARIDEVLDVLTMTTPSRGLSNYRLLQAGCARSLGNGQVVPRLPPSAFGPFPEF
jgi:hypothetical protein